jgi:hypothetical protein
VIAKVREQWQREASAEPHLDPVQLAAMAQSQMALKTFSLANDVVDVSPQDEIYRYDAAADRQINQQSPWSSEYGLHLQI